ncbi:MAG: hypothetical protein NC918_02700 [Candidatus Omnitrophica bacterium]|nr:hypothetical protein [Candidatus Omnitrophota bacterium]
MEFKTVSELNQELPSLQKAKENIQSDLPEMIELPQVIKPQPLQIQTSEPIIENVRKLREKYEMAFMPQNLQKQPVSQQEITEGLIYGTLKHLFTGLKVGVSDIIKGIVDIDAEDREAKATLGQLTIKLSDPNLTAEEYKNIQDEIKEASSKISSSLVEKLAKHGINVAVPMLMFPLTVIPSFLGKVLTGLGNIVKTAENKQTLEDLKKQWFNMLDNIVPTAIDTAGMLGWLKIGKAVKTKLENKIGIAKQESIVKPTEQTANITTEVKPKEALADINLKQETQPNIKQIQEKIESKPQELEIAEKTPGQMSLFGDESINKIKPAKTIDITEYTKELNNRINLERKNSVELIKETLELIKKPEITTKDIIEKLENKTIPSIEKMANEYVDAINTKFEIMNNIKSAIQGERLEKLNNYDTLLNNKYTLIQEKYSEILDNRKNILNLYKQEQTPEVKLKIKALNQEYIKSLADINKNSKAIGSIINNIQKTFANEPEAVKVSDIIVKEKKEITNPVEKVLTLEDKFYETPQISLQLQKTELKSPQHPIEALAHEIKKGTILLPQLYQNIKNINFKDYVDKKIKSQNIPFASFNTPVEFMQKTGVPHLAVVVDAVESAIYRSKFFINKRIDRMKQFAEKNKINLEDFFTNYEAGKYDWILKAVEEGRIKELKLKTPDDILAFRIKKFTDKWADILNLREKTGYHGKPLFRQRYLPHIVIKEISKKISEGKEKLQTNELQFLNFITGREFNNPHELSRFLNLPHIKDPFEALKVYTNRILQKMAHDTQEKVYGTILNVIRENETRATILLNDAKKIENNLIKELDFYKDKPEVVAKTKEQIKKMREMVLNDQRYNVEGWKQLNNIYQKMYDYLTNESLWEDRMFLNSLNSKNWLAKFLVNLYLRSPGKKPFDGKDFKLKESGNIVKIVGKIKDETGNWVEKEWTAREFLGRRPLSKVLMDIKGLSTASAIGLSVSSLLTNLLQGTYIYAIIPGNFLNKIKWGLKAHINFLNFIFNKEKQAELIRSGIFQNVEKLYGGLEHSIGEGALSKIVDFTMINMKISELYNRAITYEVARQSIVDINKKLPVSSKIIPLEVELLAKHVSDYVNFKYTPAVNELIFQSALGRLMLQLGSFSIKQLKMLVDMSKGFEKDPYVKKYVAFIKSGGDEIKMKKFLNNLNNTGRASIMRWILLTSAEMFAIKALTDMWVWSADPRRQIIPPIFMLGERAIKPLLSGMLYLPTNPEKGLKNIAYGISAFIPAFNQIKRLVVRGEVFPRTWTEKEEPELF